jgi:hypothetical protein
LIHNECTFVGNAADQGGGVLGLEDETSAEFTNCTMYGNSAPDGCGLRAEAGCAVSTSNTIVSFGQGGAAYSGPAVATFSCSDIYGNEGGDWVGAIADQLGVDGNISLDPHLVNPEHGVFTLKKKSPCRPFSYPNEECDLIGAWPVGNGDGDDPHYAQEGTDAPPAGSLQHLGGLVSREAARSGTEIRYTLAHATQVQLTIHDATGRLVRSLVDGEVSTGEHTVLWRGRDESGRSVAPGVYFSRLRLGGERDAGGKVVVVR